MISRMQKMDKSKFFEKTLNPLYILKTVAWPMGVWPINDNIFSVLRTLLFTVIQINSIVCVTIEIQLKPKTTEEMLELIEMQKLAIVSVLKVILLRFYHKNVAQIICQISEDWSTIKEPKFRNIMTSYANIGNFVFYAQSFSIISVICLQILTNFTFHPRAVESSSENNSKVVVFEREFPFKTKSMFANVSATEYVLIFIVQSIQLVTTALGHLGIDIFFFNLSMHVCGQFEILYEEISKIEGTDCVNATKFQIVRLIKRHQYLWEGAKTLESTFSPTILIQLLINITGICAYGIQGLVQMQNNGVFSGMKSFFSVEVLMMQLFLYCYAGEQLSSKVMDLSLATYQSSWYNLPKNLAHDLYFILMIAGRPFTMTAGKMLNMNMNTFTRIVKASLSFFSVLRLMLNS